MCSHEQKYCPSCKQAFECKVGSIHLCQCSDITLTEQEKYFIQQQFEDCLCINCLQKIKQSLSGGSFIKYGSPDSNTKKIVNDN